MKRPRILTLVLSVFVGLSACEPKTHETSENTTDTVVGTQEDTHHTILLKCEGVEQSRVTLPSGGDPSIRKVVHGFRIDPANRTLDEWVGEEFAFHPVCSKGECVTVSPNQFFVNEDFNRKDSSGGTEIGLTQFVFDRTTGSLESYRLKRVGTGKGEGDLVYAVQAKFRGNCEPVQSVSELRPKF